MQLLGRMAPRSRWGLGQWVRPGRGSRMRWRQPPPLDWTTNSQLFRVPCASSRFLLWGTDHCFHCSRLADLAGISDSLLSAVISHVRTCCIVPPSETGPSTDRPGNTEHHGLTVPAAGTVRVSIVRKQRVAVVRVRLSRLPRGRFVDPLADPVDLVLAP